MGKCVRIRGSSKPPGAAASTSCLTLRSGRCVPPVSACSPRTSSGRPRRHHHRGSALRWCGAATEAANKQQRSCGSPRRRSAGRVNNGAQQLHHDDGRPEEEVPLSRAAGTGARGGVDGRGDSFERPIKSPPLMTDDCDAAAVEVKAKAKHRQNDGHRKGIVHAGQTPPPTEAEMEAFFTAAELAERRRFAETYNYDVALDRPLEGRFEWAPLST